MGVRQFDRVFWCPTKSYETITDLVGLELVERTCALSGPVSCVWMVLIDGVTIVTVFFLCHARAFVYYVCTCMTEQKAVSIVTPRGKRRSHKIHKILAKIHWNLQIFYWEFWELTRKCLTLLACANCYFFKWRQKRQVWLSVKWKRFITAKPTENTAYRVSLRRGYKNVITSFFFWVRSMHFDSFTTKLYFLSRWIVHEVNTA